MKKMLYVIACAAVLALAFTACPTGNETKKETGPKAEAPFIKVQPRDYQPNFGDPVELVVEGTVLDGGNITYQWYSANAVGVSGTLVEGAADRFYSPPTNTAGTTYYYAEVSNNKYETRTSVKSRYAIVFVVDPAAAGVPSGGNYIAIDTSSNARHQFVRGFGGMLNAWDSPDVTVTDADTLFNPDKLGLNILRYQITPDSLEDVMNGLVYVAIDNSDLFEIGKIVNKYGGMIMGCPWTPPDGLKLPNGHMNPDKYMDMARHLVTWVNKMEAGMGGNYKVHAISSQNEPDSNTAWCVYTPEENRDFVKATFGWIKQQIPHVMLFPGEYTAFDVREYMPIVNDPAALALIDGFAGHYYGGSIAERKDVLIETGKEVWMTEHLRNNNNNRPADTTFSQVWAFADDFHNTMIHDYNAYIYWYAKRWYGLIGDSEPGVTNQRNGYPTLRGMLMSHYSKYAAGKYRYDSKWVGSDYITSANEPANIRATVYMDDETITMVMFNKLTVATSSSQWINIRLDQPVQSGFAVVTYKEGRPDSNASSLDPDMRFQQPTPVVLSADKQTASVLLPSSSFLSIRFYK
ncbi:MAG: hypothetical protein LBC52_06700 [Treponema sp.]|jgi:glucuronoarabinoxylan endo-1,4-beta-xylanase|nr:hypothetical protein [Treponema sp.]